jgi:hypothetical protein
MAGTELKADLWVSETDKKGITVMATAINTPLYIC